MVPSEKTSASGPASSPSMISGAMCAGEPTRAPVIVIRDRKLASGKVVEDGPERKNVGFRSSLFTFDDFGSHVRGRANQGSGHRHPRSEVGERQGSRGWSRAKKRRLPVQPLHLR